MKKSTFKFGNGISLSEGTNLTFEVTPTVTAGRGIAQTYG